MKAKRPHSQPVEQEEDRKPAPRQSEDVNDTCAYDPKVAATSQAGPLNLSARRTLSGAQETCR